MWSRYNRLLDWIADHIFQPPHPLVKIYGHQIDSIHVALAIYTLCMGVGLALVFGNWLWIPAAILCMILAAMVYRMLWGD
jgi:hypothetical protein